MDYKTVIEEQIRELQRRQDKLSDRSGFDKEACQIAKTISELTFLAAAFESKGA